MKLSLFSATLFFFFPQVQIFGVNSQRGEITGVMWISFGYGGPGISRWVTRGGEGVREEAHGRKRASEGDEPGRGEGEGRGGGGGVCRGGSETLQRVDGASEGSFSALTDRPPE